MRLFSMIGIAVCAVASFALALPAVATAEAAATQPAFFETVNPLLFNLLSAGIAVGVGYALKRFTDWTGISIEAKHREALQSALENAARLAVGHIENKLLGKPIDRSNPALLAATKYVRQSVPDAVGFFKLTDDKLVDLISPKLIPKV